MRGSSLESVAWESFIVQAVMESSNIHEGAEECSSSESGWTTYIASSIHETDHGSNNSSSRSSSERKGCKSCRNEYGEDGESDDSMASDASSGPSHQGHPCRIPLRSHGLGDFKNLQGRDNRKDSGKEQSKKAEKTKSTKEEPGYKGKGLIGNAFGKGKIRKNK